MLKTRVLFLKSTSSQSTLPVPSRKTWYINQLSIKPSLLIIPASSNNEVHVRIPSHSDSNIIWCQSRIQRRAPPVERQRSQRWVQPQQLLLRDVGTDAPSKVRWLKISTEKPWRRTATSWRKGDKFTAQIKVPLQPELSAGKYNVGKSQDRSTSEDPKRWWWRGLLIY